MQKSETSNQKAERQRLKSEAKRQDGGRRKRRARMGREVCILLWAQAAGTVLGAICLWLEALGLLLRG
jgi:hypothetical protein